MYHMYCRRVLVIYNLEVMISGEIVDEVIGQEEWCQSQFQPQPAEPKAAQKLPTVPMDELYVNMI